MGLIDGSSIDLILTEKINKFYIQVGSGVKYNYSMLSK